jgi:allantoinase
MAMSELPSSYNALAINPATRMDHDLYSFSARPDRPKLNWPNGAKVAVAVVINVEVGDLATTPMNVLAFSYRDYGPRVGLFRLMGILDSFGIKATLPVSDALIDRAPAVLEHALKRGWEVAGHGAKVNEVISSAMSPEAEQAYVEASFAALKAATGVSPRGWLGPSGSESAVTTALLAGAGFDYTMDWGNDEQPFDFRVPKGRLSALPYSPDTSDAAVVQAQSHTPWEFEAGLEDHLETLLAEGDKRGTVMTLGLQSQVSGQPFRAKYIRKFLEKAASTPGVWFATGAQIIDAYRTQQG